eukprot:s6437_g2.t1
MDSWHEKLKPTEVPPKLEDLVKSKEKEGDVALTQEGEARYRRVLGQLAWAALSRAEQISVFMCPSLRVFSQSRALLLKLACLLKQEVPALSSAEAELYSLVENSKELIAVALLLQTILEGIELDELGIRILESSLL